MNHIIYELDMTGIAQLELSFARSAGRVVTSEHAVTRMAVTTEKETEKQQGDNRTMGRKFTVPYGLYRAHGTVNPFLASQTGFTEDGETSDLETLFGALEHAFDFDASAARPAGTMAARELLVFRHNKSARQRPGTCTLRPPRDRALCQHTCPRRQAAAQVRRLRPAHHLRQRATRRLCKAGRIRRPWQRRHPDPAHLTMAESTMKSVLSELANLAAERGLPFLLVGGNAVILWGVPRFTRDIDLLITDAHRSAWHELITSLGYEMFHRVDAFEQFECPPRPGIDLMLVHAETWEKLVPSARQVDLDHGAKARIPDVLHLIAMKLNASRNPHPRRAV